MDSNYQESVNNSMKEVSLLEKITPLAKQINCLDLEKIAEICVKNIPDIVGVKFASLYILDESSNILHLQKHNHPFPINRIVSLNQNPPSPMVMAARCKQMIVVTDIDLHTKPIIRHSQRPYSKNYQTKNCIITPLICQEKVIGVINFTDKVEGGNFSLEDIALIELFSQMVGASVGNIKLFEKMQRQATTDGLTGLANHKRFYEILERELWRAKRYNEKISAIMIDIDNLKMVNDTYGHRVGDKVISEIGRIIKSCIRQIDTAARYGGDEFAVILPNTNLEDAKLVAGRMVEGVANSFVDIKKNQVQLSISVGLGIYDSDSSPEDITSRSDQALYDAKKAGKNTLKVFSMNNM
jgi:diguanylate cyclase (GGDEF)-like protein